MIGRMDRDQLGLTLAAAWSLRSTCVRRSVGCVLFDGAGHEVGSGYNGTASGLPHCLDTGGIRDRACPGAGARSGEGLDLCEAIHAEANALLRCSDVREIVTAYVTASPCVHCTKLLLNTGCRRIVFAVRYAHDDASRSLWERAGRSWEQVDIEAEIGRTA